jgi:diguanylate cyclase (GGDEF)-like protein
MLGLVLSGLVGFLMLTHPFSLALAQLPVSSAQAVEPSQSEERRRALMRTMGAASDAYNAGDVDLANSLWISALALSGEQQEAQLSFEILSRLTLLERRRANYSDALRYLLQQLDLMKSNASLGAIWQIQAEIGVLFEQLEQSEAARQYFSLALESATKAAPPIDLARVQVQFAGFLNDRGVVETLTVSRLLDAAAPVFTRSGTPLNRASLTLQRGRWSFALQDYASANRSYAQAMQIALSENSAAMQAHVHFRLGELALAQSDLVTALRESTSALGHYQALDSKHRLVKVFAQLEKIYTGLAQPLDASNAGREHFRLRYEMLAGTSELQFANQLAALNIGQSSAAEQALQAANALAQQRLRLERRFLIAMGMAAAVLALMLLSLFRRQRVTQKLHRELTQTHEALKAKSAEIYHASITDALTGMFNRRFGLAELASRLLHRDGALSVCVIDVDDFKAINDRYGHPIGDEVLRSISQTLLSGAPNDATLARLGGEEFLLLLPDRDVQECERLLESLRQDVADRPVWTPSGPLSVTVSLGERYIQRDESLDSDQAYSDADSALYEAKALGKNRWVRWHNRRNEADAMPVHSA